MSLQPDKRFFITNPHTERGPGPIDPTQVPDYQPIQPGQLPYRPQPTRRIPETPRPERGPGPIDPTQVPDYRKPVDPSKIGPQN